ncbi:MAG: aminotransferase class V-fold PLP-dependent enzyme [Variibacter sp.]
MTTPSRSAAVRTLETPAAASPDWNGLRAEFPTLEKFNYLDMARKAILPRVVDRSMESWLADIRETGGKLAFSMDEIERARGVVARVYGAAPDRLAFIKNTSEGVNIVANGLDWRPGDNVVISEAEHENNTFPWRHLQRQDVELRIAAATENGQIHLDAYRRLVDAKTRVVSVAWVSYGLGQRADLAGFAELCRKGNILLLIDAIQALGVLADRIDALGGDIVVSGGHKAQFSLAGAGLMYVSDRALERIRPTYASKYSFATLDRTVADPQLAPDAHRFEYGNPNFLGIWVQSRSAAFIESVGLTQIEERIRSLTERLIARAQMRGLTVRTPHLWSQRAGIVSIDLKGADSTTIEKTLAAEGIRVASKDRRIRAAVHFYNNESDVDGFVDRLAHHLAAAAR